MIAGVGCDMIEVERIERELQKEGDDFRDSIFTPGEIEYCQKKRYPAQHYAARFAAKEAVFKALSAGYSGGLTWMDVEIQNGPAGQPIVKLSGKVLETTERLGIRKVLVSLSHTRTLAIAYIILES